MTPIHKKNSSLGKDKHTPISALPTIFKRPNESQFITLLSNVFTRFVAVCQPVELLWLIEDWKQVLDKNE